MRAHTDQKQNADTSKSVRLIDNGISKGWRKEFEMIKTKKKTKITLKLILYNGEIPLDDTHTQRVSSVAIFIFCSFFFSSHRSQT